MHESLNTFMIYIAAAIYKFSVNSSDTISSFMMVIDCFDFIHQLLVSFLNNIYFTNFEVVSGFGQAHSCQQMF